MKAEILGVLEVEAQGFERSVEPFRGGLSLRIGLMESGFHEVGEGGDSLLGVRASGLDRQE